MFLRYPGRVARSTRASARFSCLWLALCAIAPALHGAGARHVFVPDPDREGAAMLQGSTWIGVGPGFTLRVQRIDERQRLAFIEKLTGVRTDPFATPAGATPRFLTFVMELENNGAGSLDFRAQQCWLVTNRKEFSSPMGMDTLRGTYGLVGEEPGPAYERVGSAFLPATRTLEPGQSLAGLAVYNAFHPATRRYKVEIQITTSSGNAVTVSAPYKRVKQAQD